MFTTTLTYRFGTRTTHHETATAAMDYAHREGVWGYASGFVADPDGAIIALIIGQFTETAPTAARIAELQAQRAARIESGELAGSDLRRQVQAYEALAAATA